MRRRWCTPACALHDAAASRISVCTGCRRLCLPALPYPTPPHPTLVPADVRLGPYCGALLSNLAELALRDAALELSSPTIFADMAGLRRLDLEGCAATRTGSWLTRVLGGSGGAAGGGSSDCIAMPAGLLALRAMRCNVFDKCAVELGGACGLQLLELSSSVQLPAALKHAAAGCTLGLHIAEEAQVLSRQGRDAVSFKACLAERLPAVQRLSATGLGRGALGLVAEMRELRRLCLLAGERRRLELGLDLPELEVARIEGYQIIEVCGRVCDGGEARLVGVLLYGWGE